MTEKPSYEALENRIRELEAERKSANRFRLLFMNAPMPYQSLDENGNFIEVNQTFLDVLGYTREELIGRNFGDLLHPDWVSHFKENFPRFKAIGEVLGVEFEMVKKDGSTILVSFNGKIQRDDRGHFQRTHCIFHDISEQKLAEKALLASENKFRQLVETINDVIFEVNDQGDITYVSPAGMKIWEGDPCEMIGKNFIKLVHPDDREMLTKRFSELRQGIKRSETYRFVNRSGRILWVVSNSSPITENGRFKGARGVLSDVTAQKQAEEERLLLEKRLQQARKAESLELMAGAIAHHFNNQLQAVMGNLEMAMDDLPQGSDTLAPLTEALKAARKVAEVSSLMLTYRGQTLSKQAPIDLSEFCRQNLPLLQATALNGMALNGDFRPSGPVIRADAGQIRQILTFLVTNACEAVGEKKGSIGLTVKTVSHMNIPASRRFPIGWQPQECVHACLEVADTGCGIPDSDIEKVFDPFFTTKFTGRGLGLSAVLGIAGAHGGGITVESAPGRGSVFRIFFPVSPEEVSIPLEKAVNTPETETGGTVLVVEDEAQVRSMVKAMLTRFGFTVLDATDGIEAVEVFRRHRDEIRCVICDLTMPRMNGWETLAALRSVSPGIPVILSSGYDKEQVMAGNHAELPQAFLGKPYQLKELRSVIHQVLTRRREN